MAALRSVWKMKVWYSWRVRYEGCEVVRWRWRIRVRMRRAGGRMLGRGGGRWRHRLVG